MKSHRLFVLSVSIALLLNISVFAQQNGSLSGQVVDSLGAIVVGASITIVAPTGTEKTAVTNAQGEFTVQGLAPGRYTVKVIAPKFALYENTEVDIKAGKRVELIATLTVEAVQEEVEVSSDEGVSTDPASNAGATILKEKELEALPDDPDELEAALQALAGPAAGPGGGQIYIDGFTGGRMPPKEAIREIRINQNPFSAEYDRLGFGRIEILTRPGADRFRGSAFGNFNDESLNSRNPFATNRASSQLRAFGGNISGPIQKGKSSFFLDISNRDVDNNSVVNALILDPSLNVVPFQEEFQLPTRRFSFSPRFDYAINDMNTLIVRYSFDRTTQSNQGIGGFSLPSRAYETTNSGNEIRLTETMIINAKTINETRFEYEWEDREQTGDNTIPTISVADAFTGGGAQIGLNFNKQKSWDLQNYTTTSFGKNSEHGMKFGARVRNISISDRSESNYGGSFSFINLNNYRDTILGNANPVQFRVTTGTPEQKVTRTDYSFFVTDDWRVSQALTLSFGLRYENQTNISDNSDLAPRFSFAWAPGAGGARAPKTVFRGGVGVFYDRFSENLTLQALRLNGTSQLDLIVSANDPDPIRRAAAIQLLQQPVFTVSGVTNVPTAAQILAALPQSNTTRRISDEIKSPMMVQAAFGMERQLPYATTLGLFFVTSRTTNVLRSRNINAPVCPEQVNCLNAPRPNPALGNVYEYESTGVLDQNRLNINFRNMYNRNFTLFGNYSLGFSEGDSDGAGSFPAYSYNLDGEFGRSSFDIRHNFVIGGNFTLPWGFTVAPFINANSGRPFNITKGVDLNGDALFLERPTYGELAARCSQLNLSASYCDVAGEDPNAIIPRNFGSGPKSFTVNLRFGKNFGFGQTPERVASTGGGDGGGPRGGGGGQRGGGGGGGFGGGRMMMGGPGGGRAPYNLNLSLNINNLFNNVNFGTPVGNMASSRFGQSTSTSGGFGGFGGGGFGGGGNSANRRIELQARFSW